MGKRVLVLVFSFLLLASLSVSGADKHKDEKMLQMLERTQKANYPDKSIISKYLTTPEPKILFPAIGDTAGYTYYDYQANHNQRRQIANGPDGILHFTWMNLIGPEMGFSRYIDYNSWSGGSWLAPVGMHVTPDTARAGFSCIDILPDNREVLGYHHAWHHPVGFWSIISIEDSLPGAGQFNSYDIPDSAQGNENTGVWPLIACSKLTNDDTAYIHITHARSDAGDVYRDLGYVRCFEKPSNNDTLVCQSPGWGSPLLIPKDIKLEPNKVPYRFAVSILKGAVVATSPVSQKVAIVWLQNTNSLPNQNEVMHLESTNNGNDWITAGNMGTPVQVTNYDAGDYVDRAWPDIATVYDYNDNLHIIWTAFKSGYVNDVTLWHWSSALPGIRKVTSLNGAIQSGSYNLCIAKPTIGVEYMEGDSAYNYLYVVYTRFWYGDISAGGYANGDLLLMASSNGGLTWRGPRESLASLNLTNTNSNGCTPGNCESEHWASIAERADSFLYIQYIYDRDAGGIPFGEGTFTHDPVRYLKYPRPLIPAIPKMGSPNIFMTSALNNSTNTDSIVISNDGSATLYVKLSGPSWITSISPSDFSIAEAGIPQIVHLTCSGAGYQDTILIDSLKIISNNDYEGGGPNYVDTAWVKVHFVVSNSFTQTEHEIINTGAGGIVMNVSNVGTIDPELDSSRLYYNGHNYLWNCSPVVLTNIPGYGWRGASFWTQRDFLPLSPLQITENGCSSDTVIAVTSTYAPVSTTLSSPYHWFWWWYAIEENSLFFTYPDSLRKVIVKYLTLHKNPPPPWWCNIPSEPPTLPSVYFGFAADFDVPNDNHGYANDVGGFDPDSNLIWVKGTDLFDNMCAGILFFYTAKGDDTTWTPYSAHVLSNYTQVSPFGDYNGDSLYKYMSLTPGWSVEPASPQDINILISAIPLNDPDTTTEVTVKYALIVTDQGLNDLYSIASLLKQKRCGDIRHDTLWVEAHSPVDIIVTDPIGKSIGIDFNTIPDATYDTTNDQDKVTIPGPVMGEYLVKVKAEPGADTGHYTLAIRLDGNEDNIVVASAPVPGPGQVDTVFYPVLQYLRGDPNSDGKKSISDVIFLINYLFKGGTAPEPLFLGDVNCDGNVTVSDVVYLINYLFKGGDAPCS